MQVNNPNNGVNQFLKDISWGPGLQVTTMSKYVVNGYKLHTEDCSKNKNSNNSGVWVQGGDGNQVGDIDFMVWSKKYYNQNIQVSHIRN